MVVDKIADFDYAMSTSESYENGSRMAEVAQVADAPEEGTVRNDGVFGSVYNGEGDEQHVNNTVKVIRTPNDGTVGRIEASQCLVQYSSLVVCAHGRL